jgi:hypothetical protein
MKKLKISALTAIISIFLVLVWFLVGAIYETHHGAGIINRTPELFWMQDIMMCLLGLTIISVFTFFVLIIIGQKD